MMKHAIVLYMLLIFLTTLTVSYTAVIAGGPGWAGDPTQYAPNGGYFALYTSDDGLCDGGTTPPQYFLPHSVDANSFFCVVVYNPTDQKYNFTLQMFGLQTIQQTVYNPTSHQYGTQNVTDYTKLLGIFSVNISNGQNLAQHPQYGIITVSASAWSVLRQQDSQVKIIYTYQGLVDYFYYKTDFSKILYTGTNGDVLGLALIFGFGSIVLTAIVTVGFVTLANRAGRGFPKFSLSTIALGVLISIITLVYVDIAFGPQLYQSYNQFNYGMIAVILIGVATFVAFLLTGRFVNDLLTKIIVIVDRDVPYMSPKKDPRLTQTKILKELEKISEKSGRTWIGVPAGAGRADYEIFFRYISRDKKIMYMKDDSSIGEWIMRLLNRGIILDLKNSFVEFTPTSCAIKEIWHVTDIKETKKALFSDKITLPNTTKEISQIHLIYAILLAMFFGAVMIGMQGSWLAFVGLFIAIILALVLVVLLVYHASSVSYTYDVTPLTQDMYKAKTDAATVGYIEADANDLRYQNDRLKMENALIMKDEWDRWQLRWSISEYNGNAREVMTDEFVDALEKPSKLLNNQDRNSIIDKIRKVQKERSGA